MKQVPFWIVLLLSLLLRPGIVFTQNITLGVKGGVGFSDGDSYSNGKLYTHPLSNGMLLNFNGGMVLNLKLNNRWYLHSEVLFEDKGIWWRTYSKFVTVEGDSIPQTQLYRHRDYYLQFPQTIRFLIPLSRKEKSSLYVEAGPYFACYLITKEVIVTTTPLWEIRDVRNYDFTTEGAGDDLNRFDWGATVGIGFIQKLWKGQLDLNLKFDHMLSPVYTWSIPAAPEVKEYKFVVALTAGYSLPVIQKDYK